MNRYWLFGSICYYARGGMCDFKKSMKTLEGAVAAGKLLESRGEVEWWHVFDSQAIAISAESSDKPYGFVSYPDLLSERTNAAMRCGQY